jgi:hypothetical protein
MTIFVNGKQKRVKRPPTIDGMDVDEFIRINADPIWLHQNEMWELLHERECQAAQESQAPEEFFFVADEEVDLPPDEREFPETEEHEFF